MRIVVVYAQHACILFCLFPDCALESNSMVSLCSDIVPLWNCRTIYWDIIASALLLFRPLAAAGCSLFGRSASRPRAQRHCAQSRSPSLKWAVAECLSPSRSCSLVTCDVRQEATPTSARSMIKSKPQMTKSKHMCRGHPFNLIN